MSKAEILEQLPKLNLVERQEIRDRIWQLEEEQLLSGRANPSDEEKRCSIASSKIIRATAKPDPAGKTSNLA